MGDGALYFGGVTSSASNYGLHLSSTATTLNAIGGNNILFAVGAVNQATLNTAAFSVGVPIGGLSTTPLSFKGQTSPNTVACGTGGTQTVSAAQAIIPFFLLTTGTLASNAVVDFSTNAPTGTFFIDLSGVGALGAFTLGFKNGTKTLTLTAAQLTALQGTGSTGLQVMTNGANAITLFS